MDDRPVHRYGRMVNRAGVSPVPARVHLAVMHPTYARAVLEGQKTVESRFSRVRAIPFGRVEAGERIYFLARGAGLIVTALADRVLSLSDLVPGEVERLRERFGGAIAAGADYWRGKSDARFGTLIWLTAAERSAYAPDDVHGRSRSYRSGWVIRAASECVYPECVGSGCRVPGSALSSRALRDRPGASGRATRRESFDDSGVLFGKC